MKYLFLLFITVFTINTSFCQDEFIVSSELLNVRSEPNKNSALLFTIHKGDLVTLIEKTTESWWFVNTQKGEGYVFSSFLIKQVDRYADWEKKSYISGQTPDCDNIKPMYDNKIENYLKIIVGNHTDVVVKLMQKQNNICIRMVYIRQGETFQITNIPEGHYYLKIAYGSDWRQTIKEDKCYGQFVKNPLYELGKDDLDFNLIERTDRTDIPSYQLTLDVITTSKQNSFDSKEITEKEFNK